MIENNISDEYLNHKKEFTFYDINLDIIKGIKYIQQTPIRYRIDITWAIISNMLRGGESDLFLNKDPRAIHDSLVEQLSFWLNHSKIILANEISAILRAPEFKYDIKNLKTIHNYHTLPDVDKTSIDIELKTRPYICGYERHNTKKLSPGNCFDTFQDPVACDAFDKDKLFLFRTLSIATLRLAEAGLAFGHINDIKNLHASKDLCSVLTGRRHVNDMGAVLLGKSMNKNTGR